MRRVSRESHAPGPVTSALTGALAIAAVGALWAYRRRRRRTENRLAQTSFAGKVVAISGGSRGLGLEMARQWAHEGARVAVCARTEADLARAGEELRGLGHDVLTVVCDVSQRDQAENFIEQVIDHWGTIDVLVNNAGIIQAGPLDCMTLADFEKALGTHFWGPLYLITAALPCMRARGVGKIVNIASIGGEISVPHLLPYCASKFALVGLSNGLHYELRAAGIHVTTVCPGLMRTGSPRNAEFKGQHRAEYAWFSIGDSLPLISINATRAARRIVRACRHNRAYLSLSPAAKVAIPLEGLFPGLTMQILTAINRLLPQSDGSDTQSKRGYESFSAWSPSALTQLTEKAARRNNEMR